MFNKTTYETFSKIKPHKKGVCGTFYAEISEIFKFFVILSVAKNLPKRIFAMLF